MSTHWGDEDDPRSCRETEVNPFMALAIIVVISTMLAILTIWACMR